MSPGLRRASSRGSRHPAEFGTAFVWPRTDVVPNAISNAKLRQHSFLFISSCCDELKSRAITDWSQFWNARSKQFDAALADVPDYFSVLPVTGPSPHFVLAARAAAC